MDVKQLERIQKKLAGKVSLEDGFGRIRKIAGADVAYEGSRAYSAAVTLDYHTLQKLEQRCITTEVKFPYMPTFLAFREVEPLTKVLSKLKFDVLLVDGQGIAHPRGVGIASHIGVVLNIPSIGVAKSRLCGTIPKEPRLKKPVPLIFNDKQVGYALKTKENTNPLYISPGHKVSLTSALEIVKHCIKKHKLPEPLRLAHELASSSKVDIM